MTRPKLASTLGFITAVCYVVVATLHGSAFGDISELARKGPAELVPHVAIMWWTFSVTLVLLGAITAVNARNPAANRRAMLVLAGCFPLATVVLMFGYLGWFGPQVVLGPLALLSFATAAVCPKPERTGGS